MKLKDKVALVTGAGRGIGKAIALALADEGADVIVNYNTSAGPAQEVVETIKAKGRKAIAIKANVSVPEEVNAMKETVLREFGRLDILVNNSGINRDKTFAKMDQNMWHEVLSTNLDGAFHCTKAFIDGMAERGYGRIIMISSIVGQKGNFGQSNYAASKAALIGFAKTLAVEYARKGVTVNVIAPGFIETDMVIAMPEEIKAKVLATIPIGRFGKPEEIGRAAAYLTSPDADFITGHVLAVNGGQYM